MLKNDAYRYFCYHGECDNQRHAAFQTEYYSLPKLWYSGHFLSACKYSNRRSVSFLHSLCHCILFFSFSSLVCAPSQFHIFPLFGFWYWKHLLCTMLTLLSFDTHRYREWMRQTTTTTTTAKLYIYNIHAGKQFIARQKSMCNNCEIPILSILYTAHWMLERYWDRVLRLKWTIVYVWSRGDQRKKSAEFLPKSKWTCNSSSNNTCTSSSCTSIVS